MLVGQDRGQLDGSDLAVTAELLDQVLDLDRGLMRAGLGAGRPVHQTGFTLSTPAGMPLA